MIIPLRLCVLILLLAIPAEAQVKRSKSAEPAAQQVDEAYTKLIREYVQDPRISTELVDHMTASDTVP